MRVILISANTEQMNMPVMPFGLACVAAATRDAGHEVALIDLMFEANPAETLAHAFADFAPECIGISVRNIDNQDMTSPHFLLDEVRTVVETCRQISRAPIVLGGAGYTMFPKSALAFLGADVGIAGEGESAFPQLLAKMERRQSLDAIPGLTLRDSACASAPAVSGALDTFPLPDADILSTVARKNPDPWIPVQTRRGCALNCSYCSTPSIEGITLRQRTPEHVAAWLDDWRRAGYGNFFFVDNTFNFPLDYAKTLCRCIIARDIDIRWRSIIYPHQVDRELVTLMAAAGCNHISLGFESGSPIMLKQMNKRFAPEEVRSISTMFADYGIERMGFLLLGGPGETQQSVEESLAFADSLQLDLLGLTAGIRICPQTPLAATAMEEGVLCAQDDLLTPRFYLAAGLAGWLDQRLAQWAASRPNVIR